MCGWPPRAARLRWAVGVGIPSASPGAKPSIAAIAVVLQANRKTHPDLPNVPQAIKLAKSDEGRKMIDVGIHGDSDIVRTYTLPPGTPKDRVQLLRKAFEATLKDPEFLADAKKSRPQYRPVPRR